MKAINKKGNLVYIELCKEEKLLKNGAEVNYSDLSISEKNIADRKHDDLYDLPVYDGVYARSGEYAGIEYICSATAYKFATAARETGDLIEFFHRKEAADAAIAAYEASDKEEGTFEEDFYEVEALTEEGYSGV